MSGIGISRRCVGVWSGMLLVGLLQTSAWGQFPPRGAYRGFSMRGPFGEFRVEVERPAVRRAAPIPVPMMPVPVAPRAMMRSFMAESMSRSMRGMGFPGPGLPMPGADLRLEIESRLAEPRLGREPGPAFEVPGYEDVERAAANASLGGTPDGLAASRLRTATRKLRTVLQRRAEGEAWAEYLQLDAVERFAERVSAGEVGATFDVAREAERLVEPFDAVSRSAELGWLTREAAFRDLRSELARWSFGGRESAVDEEGDSAERLGGSVLDRTTGESGEPAPEDAAVPVERSEQIEELPLPLPDGVVPKREPRRSAGVPYRGDA